MKLDQYTLQARIAPAMIVALPMALVVMSFSPATFAAYGVVIATLTPFGIGVLVAQIVRDIGSRKNEVLFAMWDGKPTTRHLSHRNTKLDRLTMKRYHAKLSTLTGETLPTEEAEKANPESADALYDSCTTFLRERTRDAKEFPLVLAENINYGFRRNLWALRPVGLSVAFIAQLMCCVSLNHNWDSASVMMAATGVTLNLLILAMWLFLVSTDWVRTAAFSYATQLIAACDAIEATEHKHSGSDA